MCMLSTQLNSEIIFQNKMIVKWGSILVCEDDATHWFTHNIKTLSE